MARIVSIIGVAMAVAIMAPRSALSQAQDHVDAPGQAHSHAAEPVSCTTLSMPPWSGLPEADRLQFASVQQGSILHWAISPAWVCIT